MANIDLGNPELNQALGELIVEGFEVGEVGQGVGGLGQS